MKTSILIFRYNKRTAKSALLKKPEGRCLFINTEQQLKHLLDTYQNLVFTICYRITGSYFDAEDLAQDTFLSAYKHLPYFDGKNEKAWISRIATNKAIDYLKQAGRRSLATEDTYFTKLPAAPSASPEVTLLEQEMREDLKRQCMLLKEPYREIALLYFYQEKTAAEIAKETSRNVKTVQTQIYRAKAMLKKHYEKEGIRDGTQKRSSAADS